MKFLLKLLIVVLVVINPLAAQTTSTAMFYKGMNIAGAEFNSDKANAKHFHDYIWPTDKNLEEMKALGFNTVRVPFAWERMQTNPLNDLNKEELAQLDRIVQKSHLIGLNVVLDPHNYGTYKGKVLETNQRDIKMFQVFWQKLAEHYRIYPNVIFGLMNEPYKQTAQDWAQLAQAGVDAIRQTGATQLILVPGTIWSNMQNWLNPAGVQSNAQALVNISDPIDNYAYEMHQYFDHDSSGTHQECIASDKIIVKFETATKWLKANNKKAFLGEFGAPENEPCIQALKASLEFMSNNKKQWVGWAYWTAGDWMGDYFLNITSKPNKRMQLINKILK